MKKPIKILALCLSITMVLFMSACSGGGGGSSSTTSDPAESNEWDKMEWEKGQWG